MLFLSLLSIDSCAHFIDGAKFDSMICFKSILSCVDGCREEGQTARAAQFYFRFLQICHFFQEGHSDGEEGGAVSGGSGGGVHAAGAELQRTAPRRANSGDGHASTGSGSAALLSAVLNPSAMGGGLDNNNTSTYISKAVSALISQQQQVLGGGGEAGSAGGTVTAVDGEQAEALLYLAQYHHSIGALPLASLFCSRWVLGPKVSTCLHQLTGCCLRVE